MFPRFVERSCSGLGEQDKHIRFFWWGIPFEKSLSMTNNFRADQPEGTEEEETTLLCHATLLFQVISVFL